MNKDIILITGASSDIGCEVIQEVADKKTIILAHYNKSGERIKKLKNNLTSEIIPIKADLTREKEVLALVKFIKRKYNCPNKIIHLPAVKIKNIRFKDIQWEDFQKDINLQLKSIVFILKEFLQKMAKIRYGKVIFMLSSCTLNMPPKFLSHYVAVKYAMLGLMKSLAIEFADKGININAISPSMIETNFLSKIHRKIIELNAELSPLKRNATVKDVAPLIKFLLSRDSDYMTGLNIPVSGGSVF